MAQEVIFNGEQAGSVRTKINSNFTELYVARYSVRNSFTYPFNYIGRAPLNTAESASGWSIARIEVLPDGSTSTVYATGIWNDRATLTYT